VTFGVTGASTLSGPVSAGSSLAVTGAASVGGDLSVDGSIIVKGDMITKSQQEINVGDSHIYLNAENTSTSGTSGGIVVNANAMANPEQLVSVSSSVITVAAPTAIAPDSIIQISGCESDATLNGLYIADAIAGSDITIRSIGVNAAFAKTSIPDYAGVGETINVTHVSVGHLLIDAAHNTIEFASGSADTNFDHGVSTNYINYTDRIESLESGLSSSLVDNRSNIQVITSGAGVSQHLEKRVVRIDSTSDTDAIYLPPASSETGGSGDTAWASSHRVYNNTVNPVIIWNNPTSNSSSYVDDGGALWSTTYYFDKAQTLTSIVVAPGESVQLQYVGNGIWITM